MDIIYLLIPIALVLVCVVFAAFLWAVKSGQFEDLEGPAHRILFDDDDSPTHEAGDSPDQSPNTQAEQPPSQSGDPHA